MLHCVVQFFFAFQSNLNFPNVLGKKVDKPTKNKNFKTGIKLCSFVCTFQAQPQHCPASLFFTVKLLQQKWIIRKDRLRIRVDSIQSFQTLFYEKS